MIKWWQRLKPVRLHSLFLQWMIACTTDSMCAGSQHHMVHKRETWPLQLQVWWHDLNYKMNCGNFIFYFLVPVSAVNVSTSSEGTGVAGQRYVISCSVTQQDALSVVPEITWRNPDGMELSGQTNRTNAESTTIYSASLEFDPLQTSHSGVYMCLVSLITSSTLSLPLNSTATSTIIVQSERLSVPMFFVILMWVTSMLCWKWVADYNIFLPSPLVPRSMVDISTVPVSGPFYSGSGLSLRCTIEVDSALDVPYLVDVEWLKSGATLRSDDRVSISNVSRQSISSRLYLASVDLSTLSVTSDTGTYTCWVVVDSSPPLLYVQRIVHSDMEAVTPQSKNCWSNSLITLHACARGKVIGCVVVVVVVSTKIATSWDVGI